MTAETLIHSIKNFSGIQFMYYNVLAETLASLGTARASLRAGGARTEQKQFSTFLNSALFLPVN